MTAGPDTDRFVFVESTGTISQFGPILRLPAQFPGAKGNVSVTYHPGQATLKSVTLGSTAATLEPVSAVGDGFKSITDARNAARKAAAEAAAAELDAGNEELAREVKTLELLKQRRDLQNELGITTEDQ